MEGFSYGFNGAFGLSSGSTAALSAAATLLAAESNGLALDFTDDEFQPTLGFYGTARIKDVSTPANEYDSSPTKAASSLLTYTSPSPKLCLGPAGTYRYQAHNLLTYSETLSNAAWSKQFATISGSVITHTDIGYVQQQITAPSGVAMSATVKAQAGTLTWLRVSIYDSAHRETWFNLSTGTVGTTASGVTASIVADGAAYLCTVTYNILAANPYLSIFGASADGGSSVAGTITVHRTHFRRAPSDSTYMATTSAARYDLPYEWNTSGVLQGVLVEEARTNLCLYASDMTNAAWTKSNMTTAKTATGADGVANSATTLTATAGNATALQAITSGSAARITSCFIKRRTGTGNIQLTQDNGGTWTTVTVTSSWTRVELASVTSANPTIGIRIVTNADAVDVQYFQHSTGAFVTSPIETFGSTVTRAADSVLGIATSAYPHSATNNAAMIYYVPKDVATAMVALRWDDNTSNEVVSIGHSASAVPGLTVTDGGAAQTAPLTSGTVSANAAKKLAVSWKANAFLLSNGGATAVSDTSGTLPTVTTLDIGPTLTGYIKQIVVLPVEKTSGQVEALAT